MAKPSILMLSGAGRSGTTILSLLLSQNTDSTNLGQSRDLWRSIVHGRGCSCGLQLHKCSFWASVTSKAFPDWDESDFVTANQSMRTFMRAANALEDWTNPSALEYLRNTHAAFLDALTRLLHACLETSSSRLLVDSSKSPEIALAVQLTGVLKTFILNVVRDPRAVICSWSRMGLENKAIMRHMRQWKMRQRRLGQWKTTQGANIRTLNYGDLTDNPRPIISDILAWVGANSSTDFFTGPKNVTLSWDRQHLFPPANERVLEEQLSEVEIRAPRQWRASHNWYLHFLALYGTFPDGLRYILARKNAPHRGLYE